MNVTLHHPYTLISPNGCHIEMDPSFNCLRLTVVYWLLISLSDSMVIQVEGEPNNILATSAFARYAAVYGLKRNPVIDARNCERVDWKQVARHAGGNWFC